MTITEKSSYIKGLADGLALDKTTPEGKLIAALIDLTDDMALTIADLEDTVDALNEEVEELATYIDESEDYEDDDDEDEDEEIYEVVCPTCGKRIQLSESVLDDGEMLCPFCGEKLEFDFDCCCDECGHDDCCGHSEDGGDQE